MKRYFGILSYNGKRYNGWQIQPNAKTIQDEIEKSLSLLLRQTTKVVGAGRTDTGVHAKNYVLHFDVDINFHCEQLTYKLNAVLPNDITFQKIVVVEPSAHARFDALSRTYRYYIDRSKNPFTTGRFAAYFPYELNTERMNKATVLLLGKHDFTSFSKVHTDVKTHICRVMVADWKVSTEQLVFTITADRFLRNMVRSLVGTMVEVGRGKISVEDFQLILEQKDRSKAATSAPACGLFLEGIRYPDNVLNPA